MPSNPFAELAAHLKTSGVTVRLTASPAVKELGRPDTANEAAGGGAKGWIWIEQAAARSNELNSGQRSGRSAGRPAVGPLSASDSSGAYGDGQQMTERFGVVQRQNTRLWTERALVRVQPPNPLIAVTT